MVPLCVPCHEAQGMFSFHSCMNCKYNFVLASQRHLNVAELVCAHARCLYHPTAHLLILAWLHAWYFKSWLHWNEQFALNWPCTLHEADINYLQVPTNHIHAFLCWRQALLHQKCIETCMPSKMHGTCIEMKFDVLHGSWIQHAWKICTYVKCMELEFNVHSTEMHGTGIWCS